MLLTSNLHLIYSSNLFIHGLSIQHSTPSSSWKHFFYILTVCLSPPRLQKAVLFPQEFWFLDYKKGEATCFHPYNRLCTSYSCPVQFEFESTALWWSQGDRGLADISWGGSCSFRIFPRSKFFIFTLAKASDVPGMNHIIGLYLSE